MSESIAHGQWATWMEKLQEPFDPEEVDYRVQRGSMVVAYVDARTVAKRLDDAVGAENWSFDWTPISTNEKGDLLVAKGTVTICGISKSDVGDASNQEGTKGSVSDALKRSAVLWGVARYLYDLPLESVEVQNGRPSPAALKKLRKSLPLPKGYTKQAPEQATNNETSLAENRAPTPIQSAPSQRTSRAVPMKQGPATLHPVPLSPEQHSEPTEEGWKALKLRIHKSGMCTTKADFDLLMTSTGGSYEETLAMADRWEQQHQNNLKTVPALDGTKGRN